ncbi:hypothetical protein ACI2IY_18485 [Lysobacter enzymogenes]|uniref:hypothetical protein n=1 Tax=Lysobacter enzymogenes TaxID=69 RepID=UPI00384B4BFD
MSATRNDPARPAVTSRFWLLPFALAGLAACAQPSATAASEPPKEKSAMTAPPSVPVDATTTPEEAADAAAAASDRAAAAAASETPPPKAVPPASERLPMPQGPPLANEELRARVLKLIGSLKTARDTESAHVAKVLGLPLGPDPEDADGRAVEGRLSDGGRYGVSVYKLYSDGPGKRVEIGWTPPGWKGDPRSSENALTTCSLDFAPFSDDIAALGYSRGKTTSSRKERWGFRKDVPANHITFYVGVYLYRALDGSDPKGRPCVLYINIDADDAEVKYG